MAKDSLNPRDRHCASVCPAEQSPLLRTGEGQRGCTGCGCISSHLTFTLSLVTGGGKWASPPSEEGSVARPTGNTAQAPEEFLFGWQIRCHRAIFLMRLAGDKRMSLSRNWPADSYVPPP